METPPLMSINELELDMETPELDLSGIATMEHATQIAQTLYAKDAKDTRRYLSARVSSTSNTMCYEIVDDSHAEQALIDIAFDHATSTARLWKPRKIEEIEPDAIASLLSLLAEDAELENEADIYIVHFEKLMCMEPGEIAAACGVELADLIRPDDSDE